MSKFLINLSEAKEQLFEEAQKEKRALRRADFFMSPSFYQIIIGAASTFIFIVGLWLIYMIIQ